ncbi:Tn3 family transposase [Marinicella sp. W31]|uniref:Tn3 family transposase n=1 Tax=Marinicella sp. W31 TaxID=3023713 RepID=UPI0037564966
MNYIDDAQLRRSIQKQLNRVELGQKLSEAVFFARKGQLHVGTPTEMRQAMNCKTLLKNAIILWNYLFLSDYYHDLKSKAEKKIVLESIANGSVISWRHLYPVSTKWTIWGY